MFSVTGLYLFRTSLCDKLRIEHDPDRCVDSHSFTWQRRDPRVTWYLPRMCQNISFTKKQTKHNKGGKMYLKKCCNVGRRCQFSHSKEEALYHPLRYKTAFCNNVVCERFFCPFAHNENELRCLTDKIRQNIRSYCGRDFKNQSSCPLSASQIDEVDTLKEKDKFLNEWIDVWINSQNDEKGRKKEKSIVPLPSLTSLDSYMPPSPLDKWPSMQIPLGSFRSDYELKFPRDSIQELDRLSITDMDYSMNFPKDISPYSQFSCYNPWQYDNSQDHCKYDNINRDKSISIDLFEAELFYNQAGIPDYPCNGGGYLAYTGGGGNAIIDRMSSMLSPVEHPLYLSSSNPRTDSLVERYKEMYMENNLTNNVRDTDTIRTNVREAV